MQQAPKLPSTLEGKVGIDQFIIGDGSWSYSFPAPDLDTVSIKTNAKGEVQIEVVVNRPDAAEAAKVAKEVFAQLKKDLAEE